jgi:hypothetical protein
MHAYPASLVVASLRLDRASSKGVYANFLDDEREGQVQAAYGVNYERLVALKNTYDPTNFFSLNQNIRPTVKGPRPLVQDWRIQAAGLTGPERQNRKDVDVLTLLFVHLLREGLVAPPKR